MLEAWFKHSFVYRFYSAFVLYLNHSVFAKNVELMGRILAGSRIGSCLRHFASRPFHPDGSLFFRIFQRLNEKTCGLRGKADIVLKDSLSYRLLAGSRTFPLIVAFLIPSVAFYAFIDEVGRDVLGDMPLFGLWDEAFLLVCAICSIFSWFFEKRHRPLASTPVSAPMILLIAVSVYLYLMNTTYPQVGLEGLRAVAQYLLWFFIMNSYLADDIKAYRVAKLLVYAGGAMGLHGVLQYVMKVPTPASWTDRAEGATGTRVFSIVESPNVFGSILILIIPLCVAMILQRKRGFVEKCFLIVLLGAMGFSLVFTLSRGAWIGAAVAMFIFCLAINPRWIILLGVGGSSMLLIPSVASRITYLLSPQYVASSMSGGRLMRYQKGWEIFTQHEIMGVGLGHFGGAVAMNNKNLIPNTFYMDNFWLKTAVEMGLFGIAAYGILILAMLVWGVRAIKQSEDYDTSLMAAGGFAGMCGVLLHNFMENIFEVPYMVVYFWVVASLVLYFGFRRKAGLRS